MTLSRPPVITTLEFAQYSKARTPPTIAIVRCIRFVRKRPPTVSEAKIRTNDLRTGLWTGQTKEAYCNSTHHQKLPRLAATEAGDWPG
jgi:hypothetical protein